MAKAIKAMEVIVEAIKVMVKVMTKVMFKPIDAMFEVMKAMT